MLVKQPLQNKRKQDKNFPHIAWHSSLPFVDNKLAMLIHRPREVSTFRHFKIPYIAVTNWCGNTNTGNDKFTFLESLPDAGKLLCSRCEEIAVRNGLPSAEQLTGKHVHLGKVKAIRTCCITDNR